MNTSHASVVESACRHGWLPLILVAATLCLDAKPACAGGHGHAPATDAPAHAEGNGLELGDYRIRAHYPVEAQKSTVRFVLHAAVDEEHQEAARHLLELRRHKVRDEVITVTRMAPLTIFDDAELTEFRRRMLVRLRRTLPELPLEDIYVSEFRLSVKSL